MGMERPVRLGVVFGGTRVPRWQLDMLIELRQSELCEVYPWVLEDRRAAPRRGFFNLYERVDRRRFAAPDDALSPTEIFLDGEPGPPPDLDALIWLPDRPPTPELTSPGVPVWYLAQGGARTAEDLPLAEEVRTGRGAVHTELRCIDERGDHLLLGSIGVTDRLSLHRARTRAYARAARLPLRHLRRVALGVRNDDDGSEARHPRGSRTAPFGVRMMARLALRIVAQKIRGQLVHEQWLAAYRRAGAKRFIPVTPPPDLQYADPFPVEVDGQSYLLFESFGQTGDGKIAAASIDERGHSEPETVLGIDTHLSYPFPVRTGGDVLLMPESRRKRRVELWRAGEFPRGWQRERAVLSNLPATDATLFERDGRLWLFTALAVDDGPAVDELHVFSADSLDGEWQPHPLNPVVADVHRARPAGALFVRDGELVRPAQDCSRAYGWRVVLNRVTVLSSQDYQEEPFAMLLPRGRGLAQLHTYSLGDGWEAIDVLRRTPRGPLRRLAPKAVRMKQVPYRVPGRSNAARR